MIALQTSDWEGRSLEPSRPASYRNSANLLPWRPVPMDPPAIPAMDAPALFLGVQEGCNHIPAFEVYLLLAPVGEHPVGSTISRQTLEKLGYSWEPVLPGEVIHPNASHNPWLHPGAADSRAPAA